MNAEKKSLRRGERTALKWERPPDREGTGGLVNGDYTALILAW